MSAVKVFNTVKVKEFLKQNPTGVAPDVDTTEPHSTQNVHGGGVQGGSNVASRRSHYRNVTQQDSIHTPGRKSSGNM